MERGPFGKNRPVVLVSRVPVITVIGNSSNGCSAVRIEFGLAQPEWPGDLQVGHGVGAGIRADGDRNAITKAKRQHAVHELPPGGMAEQTIARPLRQPLIL